VFSADENTIIPQLKQLKMVGSVVLIEITINNFFLFFWNYKIHFFCIFFNNYFVKLKWILDLLQMRKNQKKIKNIISF
jgi:hypothetical protein